MTALTEDSTTDDDLTLAFELAPVGLCISRHRIIQRCNEAFAEMFGYQPGELAGTSFVALYPSAGEAQHFAELAYPVMQTESRYSDERIMRHRDGQLFWCHVSGRSMDRKDPYACAVWMFEDISDRRPLTADLTGRERDIVKFLTLGQTSKQIAKALNISPRTVEAHRARLMKKLGVSSHTEMIARLIGLH